MALFPFVLIGEGGEGEKFNRVGHGRRREETAMKSVPPCREGKAGGDRGQFTSQQNGGKEGKNDASQIRLRRGSSTRTREGGGSKEFHCKPGSRNTIMARKRTFPTLCLGGKKKGGRRSRGGE